VIDYKEEVKKLILEKYCPADPDSNEVEKTTEDLVSSFQKVIPHKAIDGHVVYQALTELGYKPKEQEPLVFMWYFKRKT
jgi:hypothetical protein